MSIKADYHLHSSFSGDSQAPMKQMIERGIELGLSTMARAGIERLKSLIADEAFTAMIDEELGGDGI